MSEIIATFYVVDDAARALVERALREMESAGVISELVVEETE